MLTRRSWFFSTFLLCGHHGLRNALCSFAQIRFLQQIGNQGVDGSS